MKERTPTLKYLPFYEGEAPVALLLEGATRAPIIAQENPELAGSYGWNK